MRRRVALITSDDIFGPGGVERSIHRIARGLVQFSDWDVDVLRVDSTASIPHDGDDTPGTALIHVEPSLAVYRMTSWSGTPNIMNRWVEIHRSIVAHRSRRRWALLHGFFVSVTGFLTVYSARECGIPAIVSLRGNDLNRDVFSQQRFPHLVYALQNADAVTAVSRELRREALHLISGQAAPVVIHNSIDPADFDEGIEDLDCSRPVVGTVGVFKSKKAIDVLIKAFRTVLAKYPSATLLLVGDAEDTEREELHARIAESGVESRIRLTGYVDRRKVLRYMRAFDVFAFSSRQDGCPNVILEAMLAGCRIVAAAAGAVPELLDEGKEALLVPPSDPLALARALVVVLDGGCEGLGDAARRRVQTFVLHREIDALCSVYKRVLTTRSDVSSQRGQ